MFRSLEVVLGGFCCRTNTQLAAISAGGDIPVLVTAVKVANDRRTAFSKDLAEIDSQQHSDADYEQLKKDLKAHFETSWQTILSRQVGPTRQILRKLFNGNRLPFTPMSGESESRYEFKGTASLSGLLTGRTKAMVSPTGLKGFCSPVDSWALAFKGCVEAA